MFINGILFEWNTSNGMNIQQYLDLTWDILMGITNKPSNLICIVTCNAYVIRRIAKTIDTDPEFKSLKGIKSFLLECAALIILSKTIEELDNMFEDILNVIMERDNEKARHAITLLSGVRKKSKVEIEKLMENAFDNDKNLELEEEFYDVHKGSTTVCENTKCYKQYWKKISLKVAGDDPEKPITNPYYAFNYGTYILKTFLSYAPIVTNVMLPFNNTSISRVTNAYAESHMRVYKNNIIPQQHGNSIGTCGSKVLVVGSS